MPIAKSLYLAWNRYFPNAVVADARVAAFLDSSLPRPARAAPLRPEERSLLLRHKLAFVGPHDPYKSEFHAVLKGAAIRLREFLDAFETEQQDYSDLNFNNDPCNLACPYCVQQQALPIAMARPARSRFSRAERLSAALSVADQFMTRKIAKARCDAGVSFNGGEILLDWDFVTAIVEHLAAKYPQVKIKFALNSNMTRMTREIAAFMAEHAFEVHASIDAYRDVHDLQRRYRDGRGSFDDVLRGIRVFNSATKTDTIRGYQGTLDRIQAFDPRKVFEMARFGFRVARLGANLLGTTPEDGATKARLLADLYARSRRTRLRVYDTYFKNVATYFKVRPKTFLFNCNGLSGVPHRGLQFNLSTLELAQSCPFVPGTFVEWSDVGGDIYHARLGQVSHDFFDRRLEALRQVCGECEVVGICRGGCIMNGLDAENRLNPAACAYQRTLWREFARRLGVAQSRSEPPAPARRDPDRTVSAT